MLDCWYCGLHIGNSFLKMNKQNYRKILCNNMKINQTVFMKMQQKNWILISDGVTVVIFHMGFQVVTAVIFVITKHALIEHLFAVSR